MAHPVPKQSLKSVAHPVPKQPLHSATPLPHVEEIPANQKLKSRWAVDDDDDNDDVLPDPIHKKTAKSHSKKGRKKSEQNGSKDLSHLSIPTGPASLRRDSSSQSNLEEEKEKEDEEENSGNENKHFSKAALAFRNRLMLNPATTDIPPNPASDDDNDNKKKKTRAQAGLDSLHSSKDAHRPSPDKTPARAPACPSEPSKWEKEREARRLHKAKEARGLEWNQRRHDKLRPEGPDAWRKDAVPTQPASLKRESSSSSSTNRPEHGVSNPESTKNGPDLSKDPVKTFEDIMREAEDDDGDWADEI